MDLNPTADELAFRDEAREFLRANLPEAIRRKVDSGRPLRKGDYVTWQKILHRRGWIAPQWPKQYGGAGWTPIEQYIFEEEAAAACAPPVIAFGVHMVGPVLIAFGDEAQKRRYLPRILASDDWWCQGFSEPDAGSDLASVRTRARRDGDSYIVNGQKTWTTYAQYADMIFCLVRTADSGRKQEGISFLLIDMKSPGITVRPIITIEGKHEVNEVFFDDVRVPIANRVGEENKGWTYAKYLLGYERTNIAGVARSKQQLQRLKAIATAERSGERRLIDDMRFREKIAAVEIELMALEVTNLRILASSRADRAPGPEPSLLKIKGTEIQQAITELLLEAIGPYAIPFLPEALEEGSNLAPIGPDYALPLAPHYFNWRKVSIFGGSNEIQKNVVAKMILGF